MTSALGWLLLLALVVHFGAHVTLIVGIARSGDVVEAGAKALEKGKASKVAWKRAAIALVLPPLAPYWGWRAGTPALRRCAIAWAGSLGAYALAVAIG